MTITPPTIEPLSARAGDTWTWTRSFPAYPATAWVLTYTLFSAAGVATLTASADGTRHVIDEAPASTALITAGRYDWVAHVTDGTDRHQVGAGSIQVLPDLSEATSYDGRSHARRMLDAINAMLEDRATSGDLDVVRTAVGGHETTYSVEELIKLRRQYAAAVNAEEQAERLARGESSGRFIQTRFVG
jgi:hypothetical protein